MCMCDTPTRNGEPGYSWDGKTVGVRPVAPPTLEEGETVLFDEPGRCGGMDSHCHHFMVTRTRHGRLNLLVHHGGGDERINYIANGVAVERALASLDSDGRYWMICALFSAVSKAVEAAKSEVSSKWAKAAVDKRIKITRRKGVAQVRIEAAEAT